MMKRVKIRRVSAWNMVVTIIVGLLFFVISFWGNKEFHVLQTTTEQYIVCEQAAKNLQDASDYLTEQVQLYTLTGQQKYMNNYFREANETRRREKALEDLSQYFKDTHTFSALENAMTYSKNLMNTEYYAMRLVLEAKGKMPDSWPEELQDVELTPHDETLSASEKIDEAQQLVCNNAYQTIRTEISDQVRECMSSLIEQTHNKQNRAVTVFSDMYRKLEIGIVVLVTMTLAMCMMVRRLVVVPLVKCNDSIKNGQTFPVQGAEELQVLAETYNRVYEENQEAQMLIRHKAEHDPLTDLLNRGSFECLLKLYEAGDSPFALIMVDVDSFKAVNDTYGHSTGDDILKAVSNLMLTTFRSIDHVCRIGGDEFAVIMVEMTTDLQYTILEKVDAMNEQLLAKDPSAPQVSLSVGVAFSDRKEPIGNIFEDADKALYRTKDNGKAGCYVYGEKDLHLSPSRHPELQ